MTISQLYINPLVPATATSGTAAGGFPATNVLNSQVKKPWLATGIASTDFLQIDLGASVAVAAIGIQDANFSVGRILADNSATPTTSQGFATLATDGQNRNKCIFPFSATVRYIRIKLDLATVIGAGTAWQCGAVYVFPTAFAFPRDPVFGSSAIDYTKPQSRIDLDNGMVIRDNTGPNFSLITLDHSGGANDDMEQVGEYARAGLCWLALNNTAATGEQWPVRHHEPKISRRLGGFNRETVQLVLKEEV